MKFFTTVLIISGIFFSLCASSEMEETQINSSDLANILALLQNQNSLLDTLRKQVEDLVKKHEGLEQEINVLENCFSQVQLPSQQTEK
jgi:Tfp pilus assembly protein PilN